MHRRVVAAAVGAVLVLGSASGCDPSESTPPAGEPARHHAVGERVLVSAYDAAIAADSRRAPRLLPLRQVHVTHLGLLGADAATGPAASMLPQPSGEQLAALERTTAAALLADGTTVGGDLGLLLVSMAAGATTTLVVLSPLGLGRGVARADGSLAPTADPAASGSTSPAEPLQRHLAAVHAAVYVYGVAGPRLRVSARRRAHAEYDALRSARDEVADVIRALGRRPVPAAAAYSVPAVSGPDAALRALVGAEEAVTASAARAFRALDDAALRAHAARWLVDAAVTAARWRVSSGGTAATPVPGLQVPAKTPTPT